MKFDMSEAWREATAMFAANREVLLAVAGMFFFLPSVALGLAIGNVQRSVLTDPKDVQKEMLQIYAGWWWLFVLVVLAAIVGYLTLLALLRDRQRPTVGQALRTALAGVLPAFGTYVLFSLAIGLAAGILVGIAAASGSGAATFVVGVLCIVGFVYAAVKISLAGPVIAIDKVMNPFRVIGRSWRLTKGNSFRLFLFYLLLVIAYVVVSAVVGIVVAALAIALGKSGGLIINALLTGLLSAVVTTVFVAILAAVHRQLSGPSRESLSDTFE